MTCRISSANDQDALIEDPARAVWDAACDREVYGAWDQAAPYWQERMRLHARSMVRVARDRAPAVMV